MSKPRETLRPLGSATVLAIGFGAVFALAIGWGISVWEGLHRNIVSETLVIRADGIPLIQHHAYDGYPNVTFRSLDGSEVPRSKDNKSWLAGASLEIPRRGITFPLDARVRIRQFGDGQSPLDLWYFVHDGSRDGRGYFVGYDSQSKLRVGFIGRDGLRPDQPPVEQCFPVDGNQLACGMAFSRYSGDGLYYGGDGGENSAEFPAWKVDLISGNQLLEIDLRKGSVTTLIESGRLTAVSMLETTSTLKVAGENASHADLRQVLAVRNADGVILRERHEELAVRTADQVVLLDAMRKQHAAYLIPEEFRDRGFIFYELDGGTALLSTYAGSPGPELTWIDVSGKILRREKVTLSGGNRASDEAEAWCSALIAPSPIALAFIAAVAAPSRNVDGGPMSSYATALTYSLSIFWPSLLTVSLISAAMAVYCYRRHRRNFQNAGVVWFMFVLLAGLPGLVAYLFHRRWPVLEKCPTCGCQVPRDREACAKCGARFPAPELNGCEVFA